MASALPPTGFSLPQQRPRQDPFAGILQAFLSGQQLRQQNQMRQQEMEQNKLQMDVWRHQVKSKQLEEKLKARDHATTMQQVLETLHGVQRPQEISMGESNPGGSFEITGMPEAQFPTNTIPGIEELGLPEMSLPVRSYEQKLADILSEQRSTAQATAEGTREGRMLDLPPELAGRFPLGGQTRVSPEVLGAAEPYGKAQVPPGIYPKGHPLAAGGGVERPSLPLVESAYGQQETTKREGMQNRTSLEVARINANRWGGVGREIDTKTRGQIQSVAQRIASGELTVQQGNSLLGGVRSGLGRELMSEIDALDSRIVPPKVRESLGDMQKARNLIDQIEEQVHKVINASDPMARAQETMLLESLASSTASILSKTTFRETGVLTDKDIQRAVGLVPGWKAANFAPGYAVKEISLLRGIVDKGEQGIYDTSFKTIPRGGQGAKPGAGGAEAPVGTVIEGPTGTRHHMTVHGWVPPLSR